MAAGLCHRAPGTPRERPGRVVPHEVRGAHESNLIVHTLAVIFNEIERTVRTAVDLDLEGASRQLVGGLHHRSQRQDGARADKQRDLILLCMPSQVHLAIDCRSGVEVVPLACGQIDLSVRVLTQHWSDHEAAVHPLHRDGDRNRIVWKHHRQRAHPEVLPVKHAVGQRIMVRDQPVPQFQGLAHGCRSSLSEEPRPMRLGPQPRVHSHDGHEHTDLHPPCQQLPLRLA
mmetsp:Transcript_95707/g.243264  ORF Transcript_95707/g.243264 Transcript_95707/m.243264 type:complete len:229 (-) Transcript_95707:495-1181(-)